MTDLATGLEAFNNKEYKIALGILHPLAEAGDARAEYIIGSMCEFGLGIPQNYREARNWYKRAYEKGDAMAVIKTGEIQHQGLLGMEINYPVARTIFSDAARKGIPEAQYYLASMYENAEGVAVNLVEAHTWYNLAASNGYEDAVIARDRVAEKMNFRDIIDAQDSALFIFKNPPKS